MKLKNHTLLGLVLLGSLPAMAQESNRTDFRDRFIGGVKAGFNYSNVYDTRGEAFTTDPKSGWVAAAFISLPVSTLIGVKLEAGLSQKGFKGKGMLLGRTYELKRTTNFLDVPLLIAVKPSEFIAIVGGLQYSYLMKQTDEFSSGVTTIEQEREFDKAGIRRNHIGLVGGLDFNMKHLVLGFRASFDWLDNDHLNRENLPRYRNALLQATLGYRFYQD